MKKAFMFVAGVVFIASLSSCKKNWTCTCEVLGVKAEATAKLSKKDAEAWCQSPCTLSK